MINFDIAADFVLGPTIEGGLSDHPDDPGKRTNMGVTQRTLDSVRIERPDLQLPATVDELTFAQVKTIFRVRYWDLIKGDELPGPLAFLLFDAAVNQGVGDAIRFLQRALSVKVDGVIGKITLAAAHSRPLKPLLAEVAAQRGYDYALNDKIDDVFGLGWMRRLFSCYTTALEAS